MLRKSEIQEHDNTIVFFVSDDSPDGLVQASLHLHTVVNLGSQFAILLSSEVFSLEDGFGVSEGREREANNKDASAVVVADVQSFGEFPSANSEERGPIASFPIHNCSKLLQALIEGVLVVGF